MAALLFPALIQREARVHREVIQHAADPARTAVTQIQYLLARQTSTLRGFFISGDSSYVRRYRGLAAQERQVHAQLDSLVQQLGSDALRAFVELRTLSVQWHQEVEEELLGQAVVDEDGIPYESNLYITALQAANEMDAAVARETARRREAIAAAERKARWLQVGLGILALAATLAAARLSGHVQRLAVEAERRRQEAERALEQTARAVESKARLIRGVTHDVKNPLGAADGYAELLELGLRGELTPPQTQVVAGIRRSIRGALEIIQDLLDLSGAEAGSLQIERKPVNLAELAEEIVEEYRGSAHANGHSLELAPGSDQVIALADRARVRQILGNLLSNAIKYTPGSGHVHVSVSLERTGPDARSDCWAAVRVTDTGAGIRPEDQERIFEEFQRLGNATVEGHGLGLTISRRMARRMEGDITVQSQVGRGSTFVLWLPAEGCLEP